MVRALVWKEWRQQRKLRAGGLGLAAVVLGVGLLVAAGGRPLPFGGNVRIGVEEVLLEAMPVMLAAFVWPLVAVLAAVEAFAGDRAAGTEMFLLERPVPRRTVFFARLGAASCSTLVLVGASTVLWALCAWPAAAGSPGPWRDAMRVLGLGVAGTPAALAAGTLGGALVAAPLAALLLGILCLVVPAGLATVLGQVFVFARAGDLPWGVVPALVLYVSYPLAAYAASARGEPAGRGRLRRSAAVLCGGVVVGIVAFTVGAHATLRAGASRDVSVVVPAPRGDRLVARTSGFDRKGWLVRATGGERLSFLAPPLGPIAWAPDGSLVAVATRSGPLGMVRSRMRIEFLDTRGRSAARPLWLPEDAWVHQMAFVGRSLAAVLARDAGRWELALYDPLREAYRSHAMTAGGQLGWQVRLLVTGSRLWIVLPETQAAQARHVLRFPDCRPRAGIAQEAYALHLVDTRTGELLEPARLRIENPRALRFYWAREWLSPSGRYGYLVPCDRAQGILVVDLETGRRAQLVAQQPVAPPIWLAGDRLLWVAEERAAVGLWLWAPGAGVERLRRWGAGASVALEASPDRQRLLVRASREIEPSLAQTLGVFVWEASSGAWTELPAWPRGTFDRRFHRVAWAAPRVLARLGPGHFSLHPLPHLAAAPGPG